MIPQKTVSLGVKVIIVWFRIDKLMKNRQQAFLYGSL